MIPADIDNFALVRSLCNGCSRILFSFFKFDIVIYKNISQIPREILNLISLRDLRLIGCSIINLQVLSNFKGYKCLIS